MKIQWRWKAKWVIVTKQNVILRSAQTTETVSAQQTITLEGKMYPCLKISLKATGVPIELSFHFKIKK